MMGDPTPLSLEAERKALRAAYDALNRNEVEGFVAVFAADIERIEPVELSGRNYRGLDEVKAHVAFHRARWAEGGCEPERLRVAGDRIVVYVKVRVRLQDETDWREGRLADVFTFRDGKAIEYRTFVDRRKALEWVGLADEGAETE